MRISDWSSDVCSSDLRGEIRDHGPPDGKSVGSGVYPCPGISDRAISTFTGTNMESSGFTIIGPDRRKSRCPARSTPKPLWRSEEHTSELQSLMRISYAVFCLKKKTKQIL